MYDERNPPPVESLDAFNVPIPASNGALEDPRGPEDYGSPECDLPQG